MADGLYVEETFRHLHEIPETALKEYKTSEFIAKESNSFGFAVRTGIVGTGCVAVLDGKKKGTALGLRADMVPGLHHPDMSFDLKALSDGRELLKEIVEENISRGKWVSPVCQLGTLLFCLR